MNLQTNQLARIFSALVCYKFNPATLREIRRRNRESTDPNVCATHDFCDANMIMACAFQLTFGRSPKSDSWDDAAIWSNAWHIAVEANFEMLRIKAKL